MSFFEGVMLICFGAGWPVSIFKSLRTKVVAGKSPGFMAIIALGYLSGLLHKFFYSMDHLVWLYAINFAMVLTDLSLYYYYLPAKELVFRKEE